MFEPTLVVTGTSGSVKVVSKLYGAMTPERAAKAKLDVQHRADQLNLAKMDKPRERDFVVEPDVDEFADWRPAQMGRRR